MWRGAVFALVMMLAGGGPIGGFANDGEPGPTGNRHTDAANEQAVRPVPGAVIRPFDPPDNPYGSGHRGVDLAADPGNDVRTALRGEVHFSGVVAGTGWVSINHGGGLRTTYGDLGPRSVSTGAQVSAGDVVGELADGASHLDWGALVDDGYIDPMSLLGDWEVRLVAR